MVINLFYFPALYFRSIVLLNNHIWGIILLSMYTYTHLTGVVFNFFRLQLVAAVPQAYQTDAHSVYVITGNAALIKCEIPSFVADFVTVDSWTDNEQNEYFEELDKNYGNLTGLNLIKQYYCAYLMSSAVHPQSYI